MKTFFRGILFCLYFLAITFFVLIFPLKRFILSPDYLKNQISNYDLYKLTYNSSPQIAQAIIQERAKNSGSKKDEINSSQNVEIFKKSVTPEIIKIKFEGFLDQIYAHIKSGSSEPLKVTLTDVKPKIEIEMARELKVPLVLVKSGAMDEAIPNEYEIKLPNYFLLIHLASEYFLPILFVLGLISVLTVFGFSWLKGPRGSDKIKSFGFIQIIIGAIGLLSTLGYWIFFNVETVERINLFRGNIKTKNVIARK